MIPSTLNRITRFTKISGADIRLNYFIFLHSVRRAEPKIVEFRPEQCLTKYQVADFPVTYTNGIAAHIIQDEIFPNLLPVYLCKAHSVHTCNSFTRELCVT
jgi:hypothetical protein